MFEYCDARLQSWGTPIPACLATSRQGRRKPSKGGGGFASQPNENDKPSGKRIYSMPALYDLAFGYRNYEEEVSFLIGQYQELNEVTSPMRSHREDDDAYTRSKSISDPRKNHRHARRQSHTLPQETSRDQDPQEEVLELLVLLVA